jgi:hypothetical protein
MNDRYHPSSSSQPHKSRNVRLKAHLERQIQGTDDMGPLLRLNRWPSHTLLSRIKLDLGYRAAGLCRSLLRLHNNA